MESKCQNSNGNELLCKVRKVTARSAALLTMIRRENPMNGYQRMNCTCPICRMHYWEAVARYMTGAFTERETYEKFKQLEKVGWNDTEKSGNRA